jgi:4-amino-4-deoxy-L-arabinose transferase-like glycosyltransferase
MLAALIYVPIFVHIDHVPIRIWDEARPAMNAYEMMKNGNYIVTHFDSAPDMLNTKPPLLIWSQVFFMKYLGVNELSIRLPSAIAAFLTCLLILFFSIWYLKQFWFGFIAVMVLVTTYGYMDFHATRSGAYDSLLTLFTTLSGLSFFVFSETKKNKYLFLFFLASALAVLTKGIAGLLFLPALLFYSLWQRQLLSLVDNKHFYIGLLSFFVIVAGYYLLREINNPGYLVAVYKNELVPRYFDGIEWHKHPFWYYYDNFVKSRLSMWYLFVPCGIFLGLIDKDSRIKQITLFSTILALSYLLIISISQTKSEWYDLPMYPFLSILIAVTIFHFYDFLKNFDWQNYNLLGKIVPIIFIFIIILVPYQKILGKTYNPQVYPWEKDFYEIGYYLKDAIKGKQAVDGYFLLDDSPWGYNPHIKFYVVILQDKRVNISFKDWKNLNNGDRVITHQKNIKDYIIMNYTHDVINQTGNITKFNIYGRNH